MLGHAPQQEGFWAVTEVSAASSRSRARKTKNRKPRKFVLAISRKTSGNSSRAAGS